MPGPAERLAPDQVFLRCDPDRFDFETTDELDGDLELVGQPRAAAALAFGVGIEDDGYNLFALGPSGTGKRTFIDGFLREDMERLVAELASALPSAFEGEEYQARRNAIDEEYKERSSERLGTIHERAKERDVAMLQTPVGFMFAPIRDGEVLDADAFGALEEDEKKRVQADIEELQRHLQKVLRETPRWERERQARQRELRRETARLAIGHMTSELRERWSEASGVLAHLDAVEQDLIDHAPQLLAAQRQDGEDRRAASATGSASGCWRAPCASWSTSSGRSSWAVRPTPRAC